MTEQTAEEKLVNAIARVTCPFAPENESCDKCEQSGTGYPHCFTDVEKATAHIRTLLAGYKSPEEVKEYTEILEVAREAISDAICCEDGLDGSAGETVIKWITDVLDDYDEWIKTHSEPEETNGSIKGIPFPDKTQIEIIRQKQFDIEAKKQGYVKLAEDQTVDSELRITFAGQLIIFHPDSVEAQYFRAGQQSLINAGWRKIKQE